MTYGITDITTFVLGTIFIVLLPGPNSLYVMSVASRWGVGAGYRGACGIFLGDAILMVLSATGVASLLQTTPVMLAVLKKAGAAYLARLGLGQQRPFLEVECQGAQRGHGRGLQKSSSVQFGVHGAVLFKKLLTLCSPGSRP